jgi:hypothetical protein
LANFISRFSSKPDEIQTMIPRVSLSACGNFMVKPSGCNCNKERKANPYLTAKTAEKLGFVTPNIHGSQGGGV